MVGLARKHCNLVLADSSDNRHVEADACDTLINSDFIFGCFLNLRESLKVLRAYDALLAWHLIFFI